jgi:uncharacterized membrane protein YphA (DoxX/SURF4 family)
MSQTATAAPGGLRSVLVRGSTGQQWVTTLARVGRGVVLVVAGWIKISNPDDAVRAVQAYRLVPNPMAHILGWGLPSAELLLGVLLILGLGSRLAALAAGLMMLVYIGGIISVWVRGLSIDCGCFGGGGTVSAAGRNVRYSEEILRDLLFLAMAAWVAKFPASRLSLDGLLHAPYAATDDADPNDVDDADVLDADQDDADQDDADQDDADLGDADTAGLGGADLAPAQKAQQAQKESLAAHTAHDDHEEHRA